MTIRCIAVGFVLVGIAVGLTTVQAAAQASRSRQTATAATETYESVDIDDDGTRRILTSDRRTIIVPKSTASVGVMGKQPTFGNPVLSDDRRAAAAPAMFENCCTSYDIPMQLVVYSASMPSMERRERRAAAGLRLRKIGFGASGSKMESGWSNGSGMCCQPRERMELRWTIIFSQ